MTNKTENYKGYRISSDGSPFEVDGETVYIQHDIDANCFYGPFGYRDAQDTPLSAAQRFIDNYLEMRSAP